MVELVAFLPDTESLSALGRLCEPIAVSRVEKPVGGLSRLLLGAPGAPSIGLRSKDHTVVFKFEVFELIVEPWEQIIDRRILEMKRLSAWDSIKCLFRFEWLRAAAPGELLGGGGGIIGGRGRRENIPIAVLRQAVSMVGIVFWNTRSNGNPVAIIAINDDDPVTFRILDQTIEIEEVLVDCEMVDISNVQQWSAELQANLGASGKHPA
jgi:hypothetical protein